MYADKLREVKQKDGSVERFVDSVEECMSVLRQYETETGSRFVCVKRPSSLGKQGWQVMSSLDRSDYIYVPHILSADLCKLLFISNNQSSWSSRYYTEPFFNDSCPLQLGAAIAISDTGMFRNRCRSRLILTLTVTVTLSLLYCRSTRLYLKHLTSMGTATFLHSQSHALLDCMTVFPR